METFGYKLTALGVKKKKQTKSRNKACETNASMCLPDKAEFISVHRGSSND